MEGALATSLQPLQPIVCLDNLIEHSFHGEVDKGHLLLALRIANQLLRYPTKPSREIAAELALDKNQLINIYQYIQKNAVFQKAFTFESPMRRRISFLRQELLPRNLPILNAMFKGENCLPNHIELHPALLCNLRCRSCPNCRSNGNDEWTFLSYPRLGQALSPERLHLIIDLFLNLGVHDFSFGGGGEPSLSDLTLDGIAHLRRGSSKAEISLYTNGIFPKSWTETEIQVLGNCLNKIRFSIDAANAEEWSSYKGRPASLFGVLWKNIRAVVKAKEKAGSSIRIGASCLVSDLACKDIGAFLHKAMETGLDFCDIKAVETFLEPKNENRSRVGEIKSTIDALLRKIRAGCFSPMDVVVDDNLLLTGEDRATYDTAPSRCWVGIRGRMLTVGPYGELYPCSDAANPGAKERWNNKRIGRLTNFSSIHALCSEFTSTWMDSLTTRNLLARDNCSYCVPSHNNYNTVVDKLYQDWQFGIMPEDQPFAGEIDHYQVSRGL